MPRKNSQLNSNHALLGHIDLSLFAAKVTYLMHSHTSEWPYELLQMFVEDSIAYRNWVDLTDLSIFRKHFIPSISESNLVSHHYFNSDKSVGVPLVHSILEAKLHSLQPQAESSSSNIRVASSMMINIISTIQLYCSFPLIRLLATQNISKWLSNPSLGESVRVMMMYQHLILYVSYHTYLGIA